MKEKNDYKNSASAPVVTFLNRDQIDYLDKLGKDSFFKFGHKLSRAKLLSELVDLLMYLKINLEDIDLKHETICQGIMRLVKDEQKTKV